MAEINQRLYYGSILLLVITGTATVWGEAIGLALFIGHVGVKALPLAIIVEALLSMVFIISFEQLKAYIHDAVTVAGICLVGILILLLGINLTNSSFGYGLFYAVQRVMRDLLQFYVWNYVISYYASYNRHQIPRIMLMSRIGIVFSGLSLTLLTLVFPVQDMVWIWIVALGISASAIAIHADEFYPLPRIKGDGVIGITGGIVTKFSSAFRSYLGSHMMRFLSIGAFCMMFAFSVTYFEAMTVFSESFEDDVSLLRWFGILSSVSSLLVLPVLYGILPRTLRQISMNQVNNIFVGLVGLAYLALQILPILGTAIFGELVRTSLIYSVYDPINSQMRNVLPSSVRFWAHTFVEGVIEPLGRLVGGLILVLLVSFDTPLIVVIALGGMATLAFAVAHFHAGKLYQSFLDESLAAGQYGFLKKSLQEQLTTNQNIVDELLGRLEDLADDDREILLIAEALAEIGSDEGFTALMGMWPRCQPIVKAELLLLLAEGWPRHRTSESIQVVVIESLESPETKLRQAALRAMLTFPHLADYFRVAHYLIDPQPAVSTLAAQLLLQHPSPQISRAAYSQLNWLAQSGSASTRALAVKALVEGGVNRYGERVISVDVRRLQADTSARVRMAVVPAADFKQLIHSIADISPAVRYAAIHRLIQRRKLSYILLKHEIAKAKTTTPQGFQIAATLRYWHILSALGEVNPRYGKTILNTEVTLGLKQVDYLSSLCLILKNLQYPPFAAIIVQLQRERNQLIQAILDFVGAVHGSNYVSAITRTLQIEPSLAAAENAYQTLSQLIEQNLADQIRELLTAERYAIHLVTHDEQWQVSNPQTAIDTLLQQDDDWFELLVLYALSALPHYTFEQIANLTLIEALIARGKHSHDDSIREATRQIDNALKRHFQPAEAEKTPMEGTKMLSTIERMVFLRNVRFFENLRLDQLRALARICEELSVNEGEYILHQGEAGDSLFIIVEGAIKIIDTSTGEEVLIVVRGAGDVLGEISLFDGGLRSADAVAGTPALLLVVHRETLYNALADDPGIAMDMLRAMAQLVRNVNLEIAELTTQIQSGQFISENKDNLHAKIKPKLPPSSRHTSPFEA